MGSHEGIENTELVELHPEVVLGYTEEPRQIIAREYNSGETQRKNHVHGERHI